MTKISRAPLIVGCSGPYLTDDERDAIAEVAPVGLILFKRNLVSLDQASALIADFKALVGPALVLMDEEGGKVQRLTAMATQQSRESARTFGQQAEAAMLRQDQANAIKAVRKDCRENARAIGADLAAIGANMNASPCLDLLFDTASDVIGTRAFSADPEIVAMLGLEVITGLEETGICPIIKHLPGHGRTPVDSHDELPIVSASFEELERTDFVPFTRCLEAHGKIRAGMTNHILYQDIDATTPASTSPKVISQVIRGEMGFDGLLMSDCLFMKALSGPIPDRVAACLEAGTDLALHCLGSANEIRAAGGAAGRIGPEAWRRVEAVFEQCEQ